MMKKLTKHVNKKILKSSFAVTLITAGILSSTVTGEAMVPASYSFDKAWNGKGNVEVNLDWAKPEEIIAFSFNDENWNSEEYEIVEEGEGLKLILKEAGIKKLSLETGRNSCLVELVGRRDTTIPHCGYFLKEGENQMIISKSDKVTELLRITNRIDWNNEVEINDKYYTVEDDGKNFIVTMDSNYLDALEKKDFNIYCLKSRWIFLDLVKGDLGDVNCDGKVDLKDAQLNLEASLGIEDITIEISKLGDMDNDGKVALKDVRRVLNKALGIK